MLTYRINFTNVNLAILKKKVLLKGKCLYIAASFYCAISVLKLSVPIIYLY